MRCRPLKKINYEIFAFTLDIHPLKRILHAFYIGADLIRGLGLGALGRKRRQKGSVLGRGRPHPDGYIGSR